MKTCTKCQQSKDFVDFYKSKGAAGKRRSRCIACTLIDERLARSKSIYQADYHKANRERILKRKNASRNRIEFRAKTLIGQARRRAFNLDIEFDLPVTMIEIALRTGKCARSGITFVLEKHEILRIHPFAPSLDRKDPFKGYTASNVQVVCDMYNRGKCQNTDEQFIAFCKSVAEHNK